MSVHYEAKKDEYLISTDPSLLYVNIIHQYLSKESYWAQNIPRDVVERSISNSLCFGLYEKDQQNLPAGRQVGFARLVTDKATFAYLADVFILESFRGKGLAKWMMEVIQSHPELQGLRRWMLGTRDAHSLYEQFGWTVLDEDTRKRFMQRHFKDVYQQK
ncbi:MAG TPA: GNAT family N-acetyltransferase [Chitinophagaceae bacterium]|nr:GNAT family N-acetyltransferase [Chitinophagaceae bacterium]